MSGQRATRFSPRPLFIHPVRFHTLFRIAGNCSLGADPKHPRLLSSSQQQLEQLVTHEASELRELLEKARALVGEPDALAHLLNWRAPQER